jgi:hypothetical protein
MAGRCTIWSAKDVAWAGTAWRAALDLVGQVSLDLAEAGMDPKPM